MLGSVSAAAALKPSKSGQSTTFFETMREARPWAGHSSLVGVGRVKGTFPKSVLKNKNQKLEEIGQIGSILGS